MVPSDAREATPSEADARAQTTRGRGVDRREAWRQLDQSSIMTVELMAAVLVWGGVGLLIDRWLGTKPWAMGIGVMVGFAAGLYLVWLRSSDHTIPGAAGADSDSTTEGTARGE
jgi:F0F1-type ATP synthase assembly protein I